MKTAKEILDELNAEAELKSKGWTKDKCLMCDGLGFIHREQIPGWQCPNCNGTGNKWAAPMMRVSAEEAREQAIRLMRIKMETPRHRPPTSLNVQASDKCAINFPTITQKD